MCLSDKVKDLLMNEGPTEESWYYFSILKSGKLLTYHVQWWGQTE